jgi:hypothetical protein
MKSTLYLLNQAPLALRRMGERRYGSTILELGTKLGRSGCIPPVYELSYPGSIIIIIIGKKAPLEPQPYLEDSARIV